MRNMSFSLTTDQMRAGTKTVTRRLGWLGLRPGALVRACVKCMGLPKGARVEPICVIEIVDVRREPLAVLAGPGRRMAYLPPGGEWRAELDAEGFPDLHSWDRFVRLFPCSPLQEITRIEFRPRPDLATCCGRTSCECRSKP